tara:strand:+ start:3220 stop:3396 length:177 start_codon:yes stop_codon:yes gene_type:complete
MTGGGSKWRTVSVYAPLIENIQKLIDEKVILYSNVNQFANAVIERAYQEALSNIRNED